MWLEQYTSFMMVLGAVLVPVGGVLVAHYYLQPRADRRDRSSPELYDADGPFRGVSMAGMPAWAAGAAAFFAPGSIGGTLPALVVSVGVYLTRKGSRVLSSSSGSRVLGSRFARALEPRTQNPRTLEL